jgi:hypothetical protein
LRVCMYSFGVQYLWEQTLESDPQPWVGWLDGWVLIGRDEKVPHSYYSKCNGNRAWCVTCLYVFRLMCVVYICLCIVHICVVYVCVVYICLCAFRLMCVSGKPG